MVNTTGDDTDSVPGDGICSTGSLTVVSTFPIVFGAECTLRAAIDEANVSAGLDAVEFSGILPQVAGIVEILPSGPLPAVFDPIMIDGYSHPGFDLNSLDPAPMINLLGSSAGDAAGLTLIEGTNGSTVRGLAIANFQRHGIQILPFFGTEGPTDITIQGNHIGITRGFLYSGNAMNGLHLAHTNRITVGEICGPLGGCGGLRNNIAANQGDGIHVDGARLTRIAGNYIGTNRTGTATFVAFGGFTGNGGNGIYIGGNQGAFEDRGEIGSKGSVLGFPDSTPDASGNLISGNGLNGIEIDAGENELVIQANRIGTNLAGTSALPNGQHGIYTEGGGAGDFVGTEGFGRNLISGNTLDGIRCSGSGRNRQFKNNYVGVNLDATDVIPNGGNGISSFSCEASIYENVIGGNGDDGILASGNLNLLTMYSNFVGTSPAGAALGNQRNGIGVSASAFSSSFQVGREFEGNTIGWNGLHGIDLNGVNGVVEGNFVGTTALGYSIGNSGHGIRLNGVDYQIGDINGRVNGKANTIGANGLDGISITTSNPSSTESTVEGNYIGTNENGDDLGNAGHGIFVNTQTKAEIGAGAGVADADVARHGNVIANNALAGIQIVAGNEVAMRGNQFYANAELPIDLAPSGATPNDSGDGDLGPNRLMNTPFFDASTTIYDELSGDLEIRYLVDTLPANAAYPLVIDFYARDPWLEQGDEARVFLGSDSYPSLAAGSFREIAMTPLPGTLAPNSLGFVFETHVATATDADGNTSELSVQPISVPEPTAWAMLAVGILGLSHVARRRRLAANSN